MCVMEKPYLDNNDASCADGFVFDVSEHGIGVVLKLGQVHLNVVELDDGPKGQILRSSLHGWREELQDRFVLTSKLLHKLKARWQGGRN